MRFLTILALLVTSFSFNTMASGNVDALTGICDTVAQDNKSRFRKKLKQSKLKLRDIYDGISCEGEPLVRYAIKKGANETGSFIVKRLPVSHFKSSGDLDWAANNGFADTAVAQAIAKR